MPRKQPPSTALGTLLAAKELDDPFRPERTNTVTSVPMVTFTPTILIMTQMPPQAFIPTGAFSSTHVTPQNTPANPAKYTTDDEPPFYHTASGLHQG